MIVSILFLLALVAGGDAYVLARRVEQQIGNRATYQGGWALYNPGSCPQNYTVVCGDKTNANQQCCPNGNTCFGTHGYCCPTSQDCTSYVTNFAACGDPSANMFEWSGQYFCCAQGLTAVIPTTGYPFCETPDVSVPQSILATMVSQYGGTAATTPAVTGNPANSGAGIVTPTAGLNPTATSSSSSPTKSATSSSGVGPFTTAQFVGLLVGGLIAFVIALSIWRWCKVKVRNSLKDMDQSHSAGPSMRPAYIPTNVQIYEPAPRRSYGHAAYDPVLERHSAVSPMSPPPPVTPSPAYSAVDQHEMPEGRGVYDPIEVHGVGSARGRVELA